MSKSFYVFTIKKYTCKYITYTYIKTSWYLSENDSSILVNRTHTFLIFELLRLSYLNRFPANLVSLIYRATILSLDVLYIYKV